METDSIFGEVIHSYTRAQAIEDGVLVDVTATAREAGYGPHCQVVVTIGFWNTYVVPDPRSVPNGQSIEGRLWDVLFMGRSALQGTAAGGQRNEEIRYRVSMIRKAAMRRTVTVKMVLGCTDDGLSPAITIMLPEED